MFAKEFILSAPYEKTVLEKLHRVQIEILNDFIMVCEKYDLTYFAIYGTAIGAVRHHGFIPWDDDIDVGMLRKDYEKFCGIFQKELGEKYNLLTPEIDERYACTVTHIQKKGTKFVSQISKNMQYEQCIFIDIFPFDYVAKDNAASKKQAIQAVFLGKLLFLSGTPYPNIMYSGLKKEIAGLLCNIIHYVLKIFNIKTKWIYKKYIKTVTQYNIEGKGDYITSFEYEGCLKDKIKKDELFPLDKVKFENLEIYIPANNDKFLSKVYGNYMEIPDESKQVNHMPLILDFGDGVNVVQGDERGKL